jgi:hypothetical protein
MQQEIIKQTHLSTEKLSELIGVKSTTIRRGYCINGHYLGIKPVKLPNRRLVWPVKSVSELLSA